MNILNEPPLQIGEVVDLGRNLRACFDGEHVVLYFGDAAPQHERIKIPAIVMAHLFWLNRRIQRDFPESYCVDLCEVLEPRA